MFTPRHLSVNCATVEPAPARAYRAGTASRRRSPGCVDAEPAHLIGERVHTDRLLDPPCEAGGLEPVVVPPQRMGAQRDDRDGGRPLVVAEPPSRLRTVDVRESK